MGLKPLKPDTHTPSFILRFWMMRDVPTIFPKSDKGEKGVDTGKDFLTARYPKF